MKENVKDSAGVINARIGFFAAGIKTINKAKFAIIRAVFAQNEK